MTVEHLRELYRHMEWADARVWRAVAASEAAAADARIREWLVHLHVVQRAFLHVWTARDVGQAFRTPADFAAAEDVRAWARPYYAEAAATIEAFTPERLAQPVTLPWAKMIAKALGHDPSDAALAETCFQVTSHSTHHRGQINARLRELGGEPPLVDYIAWVWSGKPDASWE